MMLSDVFLIFFILVNSFALRLGEWAIPGEPLLFIIILAIPIAIPIFYGFGLYWTVVRHIGLKALWTSSLAITFYSMVWGILVLMLQLDFFPRSVIIINWLLSIMVIGGSRILVRWLFSYESNQKIKKNVIIYGAGEAGRGLAEAIKFSKDYQHIAFIDDDPKVHGTYINNVPIFPDKKISSLVNNQNIQEILIALPSISRKKRKNIIEKLSKFSIRVRVLPSVSDLTKGRVTINDLFEIDIVDLLGRNSVSPNKQLLSIKISNKVVLVTGAGGSIGSEICRQIVSLKPKKLILFEISEASLYQIEQELIFVNKFNIEIYPVIGSVSDKNRLQSILNLHKVQTIYHAAAYKHVPLVESNKSQGVLNNALGTMFAVEAAIAEKVETFVLISTDKAVRPTSTMGASKRVAELVLQALSKESNITCLTMVRFGNVLDSSGSVIPLFKKQIKQGGPITITDIQMERFFMTIPEAVELVIQAGAMGKGGDVFVLDMGKPVKIYDLAIKMIKLSGLQLVDENNPEGDIEIKYTGLRPGEKLYEELLVGDTSIETENKLIMRATEEMIEWRNLKPLLDELNMVCKDNNADKILQILLKIVPEFNPKPH